jgi:hypothetical protein
MKSFGELSKEAELELQQETCEHAKIIRCRRLEYNEEKDSLEATDEYSFCCHVCGAEFEQLPIVHDTDENIEDSERWNQ